MEKISLAEFEKYLNCFLSSIESINPTGSSSWKSWEDAEHVFYVFSDIVDEDDNNNITLFDSYDKEDNEYEKECFIEQSEACRIFDDAIKSKGKTLIKDLKKMHEKFYDEFYPSRIKETARYLEKNL